MLTSLYKTISSVWHKIGQEDLLEVQILLCLHEVFNPFSTSLQFKN